MESTNPLAVVRRYFDALAAKDFATVAGMFADDIVWHQPGGNRFSGTHRGSAAVNEMIGGMMTVSEGIIRTRANRSADGQWRAGRGSCPLHGHTRRRSNGTGRRGPSEDRRRPDRRGVALLGRP